MLELEVVALSCPGACLLMTEEGDAEPLVVLVTME